MKKIIFIFLILFSLSEVVFAKTPFTEFKVGYLDPRDTKAGYIFGINVGRMIDESLSWSFELNYFQKNYKKITDVAVSQNGLNRYSTKELRVELTSRILELLEEWVGNLFGTKRTITTPINLKTVFLMDLAGN